MFGYKRALGMKTLQDGDWQVHVLANQPMHAILNARAAGGWDKQDLRTPLELSEQYGCSCVKVRGQAHTCTQLCYLLL
jgi:hypothetical protein